MANDLETMRRRLGDKLHDTEDEVWSAGEKDELLTWAVRRLNQRLLRPLDPEAAAQQITLVDEDYFYAIDAGITHISRVDFLDSDGDDFGEVEGWEVVGDMVGGTAKLHVSDRLVRQGGTLRIIGYGRYTLPLEEASQATAIPDDYVPLVLNTCTAEAYNRMLSDRVKFRQWQNANQTQNVSINELIQMVNQAERARDDEMLTFRTWQKPVPGRQ